MSRPVFSLLSSHPTIVTLGAKYLGVFKQELAMPIVLLLCNEEAVSS